MCREVRRHPCRPPRSPSQFEGPVVEQVAPRSWGAWAGDCGEGLWGGLGLDWEVPPLPLPPLLPSPCSSERGLRRRGEACSNSSVATPWASLGLTLVRQAWCDAA